RVTSLPGGAGARPRLTPRAITLGGLKDRRFNNFPGSRAARYGSAIPLGQDLIEDDLLERVLAGAAAPTPIAAEQQRGRSGVDRPPLALPPVQDAVAGELAGIVARPQVHVPTVAPQVMQPVGDDYARGDPGEVVVEQSP